MRFMLAVAVCLVLFYPSAGRGFTSGSTGVDGAFEPTSDQVIDLSAAGTGPGKGVYDPVRWAVVFNYARVTIPDGVDVTFKNHPSGAPVVWLVIGKVSISGRVSLNGTGSGPGPGGFAGGAGEYSSLVPGSDGFGPGGGRYASISIAGGGGFGTVGQGGVNGGRAYSDPFLIPLIGGSGGGGTYNGSPGSPGTGSSGGGAILIAGDSVFVNTSGAITANGHTSYSGGSGGAIRVVANVVTGPGELRALGGNSSYNDGGQGRIRIEAGVIDMPDSGQPPWTYSYSPALVFPDATYPALRATLVDGVAVPTDPVSGVTTPDVIIQDTTAVTVNIVAFNVPPGTVVDVVVVPNGGTSYTVQSTPLSGTLAASTATASVSFLPAKRSEIFLRANW